MFKKTKVHVQTSTDVSINKCHTSNIVLIPKSCVGYSSLDKMVTWVKCTFAKVTIVPSLEQSQF